MAAGQDQQFQGALDSLFNFAFNNANKPPQRFPQPRRNQKGTSVEEALSEVVTKPWQYLGNKTAEAMDRSVQAGKESFFVFGKWTGGDPTLLKTYINKANTELYPNADPKSGLIEIKLRDIVGFIKNPEAKIDEIFEGIKAQRKMMGAYMVGQAMDTALTAAHAKRLGLSSKDSWELGLAAGGWSAEPGLWSSPRKERLTGHVGKSAAYEVAAQATLADEENLSSINLNNAEEKGEHIQNALIEAKDPGKISFTDLGEVIGITSNDPSIRLNAVDRFAKYYYKKVNVDPNEFSVIDLKRALMGQPAPAAAQSHVQYAQRELNILAEREDSFRDKLRTGGGNFTNYDIERIVNNTAGANNTIYNVGGTFTRWESNAIDITPGAFRNSLFREKRAKRDMIYFKLKKAQALGAPANVVNNLEQKLEKAETEAGIIHAINSFRGYNENFNFNFQEAKRGIKALKMRAEALNDQLDPAHQIDINQFNTRLSQYLNNIERLERKHRTTPGNRLFNREAWDTSANGSVQPVLGLNFGDFTRHSKSAALELIEARKEFANTLIATGAVNRSKIEAELASFNAQQQAINGLTTQPWRIRTGNIYAAYNSMKSLVTSGGPFHLKNVIDGTFFWKDPFFSPGAAGVNRVLTKSSPRGHIEATESVNSFLIMPKDDTIPFYNKLSYFYYLTPGSIIRTLTWDGQGLKFVAAMKSRKLVAEFTDMALNNDELKNYILGLGGDLGDQIRQTVLEMVDLDIEGLTPNQIGQLVRMEDFSKIVKDKYMEIWEAIANDDNFYNGQVKAEILRLLEKHKTIEKTWLRAGELLSWPSKIYNKLVGERIKKMRKELTKLAIKAIEKYLKDGVIKTKILEFVGGKVGLTAVVKTIVIALLNLAGITLSAGVINIIVTVVIFVAPSIIKKGLKTNIKMAKFTISTILLSIFVIGAITAGLSSEQERYQASNSIAPFDTGDNYSLDGSGGAGYFIVNSPPGADGTYTVTTGHGTYQIPANKTPPADFTLPPNVQCPVDTSSISCAQGPFGLTRRSTGEPCGSHTRSYVTTYPIDITTGDPTFRAPSDVTVISYTREASGRATPIMGGRVVVADEYGNQYRLLHVVPARDFQIGETIKQGEPIAAIQSNIPLKIKGDNGELIDNPYWTGRHFHFDVFKPNESYNTLELLNSLCPGLNLSCAKYCREK